jgi:hypothetical protein
MPYGVRAADYQLIARQLYKLGLDNILRDVSWIMKDRIYSGNAIVELQEAM